MERFYKFSSRTIGKVFEFWLVYLISVVMNKLGDNDFIQGKASFWEEMLDYQNSAIFILYLFTIVVIVWAVIYLISKSVSVNRRPSALFTQMMREHTDESLGTEITSGLSWGMDKTLVTADPIILGWTPAGVVVENYDDTAYEFKESQLALEHADYKVSEAFQKAIALGNNLPRYMVTRCKRNFNKDNPLLVLNLRRTEWSYASFVWNRFGKDTSENKDWHKKIVGDTMRTKGDFLPHSLCLHLIIETVDGNMLVTEISREKSNDYPCTKAASLGEQIELADIIGNKDFNRDFVSVWAERAVCEEFGLSDEQYEAEFYTKSLRVLALDMEADIYNVSLACTIKMRNSVEHFKKEVNSTIAEKEISDMYSLGINDIPSILLKYPGNSGEYHPSSYLRFLLFYIYKNGYKRTCNAFKKLA